MKALKLKVCGMRERDNIKGVVELSPDFMGFIFYPKSSRYAGEMDPSMMSLIPPSIAKVGVFVNESLEHVRAIVQRFSLDYVQLHGDESPSYIDALKGKKNTHRSPTLGMIKTVHIDNSLPDQLSAYKEGVDYFLFDTASASYGGTGRQFDWAILDQYALDVPYLLSGGIGTHDITRIRRMNIAQLAGIDVNSRFEDRPALKNLKQLSKLKALL